MRKAIEFSDYRKAEALFEKMILDKRNPVLTSRRVYHTCAPGVFRHKPKPWLVIVDAKV